MTRSIISNSYGDPQIKTAAPADKQPSARNVSSKVLPSYADYASEVLGKPAFQKYETIPVIIDPSNALFSHLAERIHSEVLRISAAITEPGSEYISKEEMTEYLATVVKMRVLSVNGLLPAEYRKLPGIMVHPFFATIIDQIGLVRDNEFGLDFVPTIKNDSLMLPKDLVAISEKLFVLEPAGLRSVEVMVWKDTIGSLEFMSLQHINGVVSGMKVAHTVYGFFAAMFDTMAVYESVGLIPRVVYGYDNTYRLYLDSIFNRS